jgi:hypothetical protein
LALSEISVTNGAWPLDLQDSLQPEIYECLNFFWWWCLQFAIFCPIQQNIIDARIDEALFQFLELK